MEKLNGIINLLGEDNEKKLKNGIMKLLLQQVENDLADKYKYEYIIAFDDLFEEVKQDIEKEFKEKLAAKYREHMDREFEKIFNK